MNRSLLRFYSLAVCVLTTLSVLLIAGIPLWQSMVHSAEAVQQHEVYQFFEQAQTACQDCTSTAALSLTTIKPAGMQAFQPTITTPAVEESWLEQIRWIPDWVLVVFRVLIGVVGMLIVAVHWRLYQNLGYVQ